MWVYTCSVQGKWRFQIGLELEFQEVVSCPMWVLGTECGTSARVVCESNSRVISPAPCLRFYVGWVLPIELRSLCVWRILVFMALTNWTPSACLRKACSWFTSLANWHSLDLEHRGMGLTFMIDKKRNTSFPWCRDTPARWAEAGMVTSWRWLGFSVVKKWPLFFAITWPKLSDLASWLSVSLVLEWELRVGLSPGTEKWEGEGNTERVVFLLWRLCPALQTCSAPFRDLLAFYHLPPAEPASLRL